MFKGESRELCSLLVSRERRSCYLEVVPQVCVVVPFGHDGLVCGSILKVPEGYDHEPLAEVCLFPFVLTPNTRHAPMSRKPKDHIPFRKEACTLPCFEELSPVFGKQAAIFWFQADKDARRQEQTCPNLELPDAALSNPDSACKLTSGFRPPLPAVRWPSVHFHDGFKGRAHIV